MTKDDNVGSKEDVRNSWIYMESVKKKKTGENC